MSYGVKIQRWHGGWESLSSNTVLDINSDVFCLATKAIMKKCKIVKDIYMFKWSQQLSLYASSMNLFQSG